jgi:solute carrier family 25 phosphate transporter 23/24/25/41
LEGPGAFYRGFIPSSIGIFSYIGFNYAIYEFLRPMMILYDTKSSQLGHPSFPGQVLCSATAALASQFLSYPFDLMRRRLQVAGSWNTTAVWPHQLSAAMNESHRLQITGLYRGFFANSLKALPSAVISLWGYEKIKEYCLKG